MPVAAVSRRFLIRIIVMGTVAVPVLARTAGAEPAGAEVTAPIQRLNAALLAIMKAGQTLPFQQRYEMLAPVVEQTFDLSAILQLSVGPRWASLSGEEQARLATAFRRYTIATYVANFDSFSGQLLQVSPEIRNLPNGDRTVQTTIASPGQSGHTLGYVMRQAGSGWKVVDVLADGSVSRVAAQRSDFRAVLASGGGAALAAKLERKIADLSRGRLA
jgi:phospholipid transport system substrate-binding protein